MLAKTLVAVELLLGATSAVDLCNSGLGYAL